MWKVYGLIDPRDGTIRYVGCTTQRLRGRLGHHISEAKYPGQGWKAKRSAWIREILAASLRPTISELGSFSTREEGWESERAWIARLRDQLVNETSGGGGLPDPTEDLRERMSIANSKAQKLAWAKDDGTRRAAMGEIGKRNWRNGVAASVAAREGKPMPPQHRANIIASRASPEYRERISATMRGKKPSREIVEKRLQGKLAANARRKVGLSPEKLLEFELQKKRDRKEYQRQWRAARKQLREADTS